KGSDKGELAFKKIESLTDDDSKDTKLKGSYAKTYTIQLTKGKAYRIDLSSSDFDTFLRLENAAGKELAFNDDIDLQNKNLNSRLLFLAPKTGAYKLVVTTYEPGKTGAFVLEAKPATEKEAFEARVNAYADLDGAEQRKIVVELTKKLEDKGEDL